MCQTMVAPVLRSGFRPFYVVGPLFGLLAMGLWLTGSWGSGGALAAMFSQRHWHGHEMIFGFGGAMCGGFILTALPSWAKTPEVTGRPLAVLVAAWLLGRLAVLLAPQLPPAVTAAADLAFWSLLTIIVLPQIVKAGSWLYLALAPVLAGFIGGNLCFHLAILADDPVGADRGVLAGYYSLMLLYCQVSGLLVPVFCQTWLKERGRLDLEPPPALPLLEWAALLGIVVLAAIDLAAAPPALIGATAVVVAALHVARMVRWRGLAVMSSPLLAVMQLGYGMLVLSLLLRAVEASAAIHAFTIGAWGLTKFSLMTRVSLKHTGRPLLVPTAMKIAFAGMGLAAAARIGAAFGVAPDLLMPAAVILWFTPLLIYLLLYLPILTAPSLPGATKGNSHG